NHGSEQRGPLYRHPREGGDPWTSRSLKTKSMDSRLRGNDESKYPQRPTRQPLRPRPSRRSSATSNAPTATKPAVTSAALRNAPARPSAPASMNGYGYSFAQLPRHSAHSRYSNGNSNHHARS